MIVTRNPRPTRRRETRPGGRGDAETRNAENAKFLSPRPRVPASPRPLSPRPRRPRVPRPRVIRIAGAQNLDALDGVGGVDVEQRARMDS